MLLKRYRNTLLETVQKKGFDPTVFSTSETTDKGQTLFAVGVKDTRLAFHIYNPHDDYHKFVSRFRTFTPLNIITQYSLSKNVDELINKFSHWLDEHVRPCLSEMIEPDLWEQMKSQKPLISTSELTKKDKNLFSDDEKVQVKMSINEFRIALIKNFNPSSDELKVIDDRLTYLSDAVDRLNRIDWRSIAITTLIAISLTLGLDGEKAQQLYTLFQQVFSGVMYLIQ